MRKISIIPLLCLFSLASVLVSSGNKQPKLPPIDLNSQSNAIQIPYDDRGNNQIWITVDLNGVPIKKIYNTGFNGKVSMSLLELQILAKNGQLTQTDIIGTSYSSIANGYIVENGIVVLRSIKLADGIELNNVRVQVSPNQTVPVLLG